MWPWMIRMVLFGVAESKHVSWPPIQDWRMPGMLGCTPPPRATGRPLLRPKRSCFALVVSKKHSSPIETSHRCLASWLKTTRDSSRHVCKVYDTPRTAIGSFPTGHCLCRVATFAGMEDGFFSKPCFQEQNHYYSIN